MIDPLYRIKKVAAEQREDLAAHITGGGVKDFAEYGKAVGAIQALDLILSEVEDIERQMLEE